jgi:hypothetical protein
MDERLDLLRRDLRRAFLPPADDMVLIALALRLNGGKRR